MIFSDEGKKTKKKVRFFPKKIRALGFFETEEKTRKKSSIFSEKKWIVRIFSDAR